MPRTLLKRVLLAAAISLFYSVTLGLLFAACAAGRPSWNTLMLPGVVPVALLSSSVTAAAMTPVATWSLRTGTKNLSIFGPVLWAALAIWIAASGPSYLYSTFILAVVGTVLIGFIPRRDE